MEVAIYLQPHVCPNLGIFVLMWAMADVKPESWVFTTLLAQDSVTLIQEFYRHPPSSTCHFSHRPICPSFHQRIDIYVWGSRVFVEIFPTFKETNVASKFCPIYNPALSFFPPLSLKQEGPSEHLLYHVVERREAGWGLR